ncbi:unnamed protein product [Ixodes persulcatus]
MGPRCVSLFRLDTPSARTPSMGCRGPARWSVSPPITLSAASSVSRNLPCAVAPIVPDFVAPKAAASPTWDRILPSGASDALTPLWQRVGGSLLLCCGDPWCAGRPEFRRVDGRAPSSARSWLQGVVRELPGIPARLPAGRRHCGLPPSIPTWHRPVPRASGFERVGWSWGKVVPALRQYVGLNPARLLCELTQTSEWAPTQIPRKGGMRLPHHPLDLLLVRIPFGSAICRSSCIARRYSAKGSAGACVLSSSSLRILGR